MFTMVSYTQFMPFPAKVDAEIILKTAVEFVEEGREQLSMRAIAERLGLTVSSLYRYYPDRAALDMAVAERAARLLEAELRRAERSTQPLARALRCYRQFAVRHPGLYRKLLAPRPYRAEPESPFKQLWNTFLRLVSTVTGKPDDTDAAVAVWSFLYGYMALEQSGQFGPSGPKGGFEAGVAALLRGLAEGTK